MENTGQNIQKMLNTGTPAYGNLFSFLTASCGICFPQKVHFDFFMLLSWTINKMPNKEHATDFYKITVQDCSSELLRQTTL